MPSFFSPGRVSRLAAARTGGSRRRTQADVSPPPLAAFAAGVLAGEGGGGGCAGAARGERESPRPARLGGRVARGAAKSGEEPRDSLVERL